MSVDIELLRRWRDGDSAAGNTLIRTHYATVFKGVLRLVSGVNEVAEDLTQVTFEAVLDKRLDIVESFRAYVRTIARRKVLEHFRRPFNRNMEAEVSRLVESTVGGFSRLAKAEEVRRLVRALRSLSLEKQEYLMWTYAEGLSQEEIASRVGLTRSQVNGRIGRARQSLRRRLEDSTPSGTRPSIDFDAWASSVRRRDEA